jgi:Protein of unknown function (DUF2490)
MNNKLPAYKKPFSWLLFALLMASMNSLRAQEVKVVSDLQLWTGASLEKKLGKDWTLSLGEEIRFKHNISEINNYFSEAGLRFRITKNFGLEVGYRYTRDKKANSVYQNLSRYNLDLRYKGKLDFITIYYRLRYQKEVEDFNLFAQGIDYEKYLRNRIRIRYNDFRRIKPYVSAELFQLFTPDQPSDLDYIRLLLGVKYEPGDMGSFGLAYGLDRELCTVFPANIYQLKLSYTYQF